MTFHTHGLLAVHLLQILPDQHLLVEMDRALAMLNPAFLACSRGGQSQSLDTMKALKKELSSVGSATKVLRFSSARQMGSASLSLSFPKSGGRIPAQQCVTITRDSRYNIRRQRAHPPKRDTEGDRARYIIKTKRERQGADKTQEVNNNRHIFGWGDCTAANRYKTI